MRVCIEPGHSTSDPGAVVEGIREADIVQAVAKRLVALSGDGIAYEPKRRPAVSNGFSLLIATLRNNPPDVIVSLHCDSSARDPQKHICRVYHADRGDSKRLATALAFAARSTISEHSAVVKAPWDRAGKPYTYPLLRIGKRASCLVELGYLSDVHAREAMQTEAWQAKAARVLDLAIRGWAK